MKGREIPELHRLDTVQAPEVRERFQARAAQLASEGAIGPVAWRDEDRTTGRKVALLVGVLSGVLAIFVAYYLVSSDGTDLSPAGSAESEIFLPTLAEQTDSYPAAELTGTLVISSNCIFVDTADPGHPLRPLLIIWPNGTQLTQDSLGSVLVTSADGQVIARVGEKVDLGGGLVGESRDDTAFAEQLISSQIPERCKTDAGYFITSG